MDSRALALTALQRGVTSICLQHGALMGEEAFFFFAVFCSIQAVFGRYEQDWYLNKGCNKERILITGHPRFDRIFQTSAAGRPSLYRRLRLSPSQKTILIATQPFSSSFYPDLLKKLTAFPDLQMILKPHPWEIGKNQLTDYLHFTKNPRFRLVKKEIELYELLPNVDGVITLTSTVGLEAMLFGKPVWIGDPAGERDYPYYRALGEQVICHPETLAENVQRMLSDPEGLTLAMEKGKRFIQDNYPQHQSAVKLLEVLKDKTGIDFGKNQG
ncbi:CDP-glycerol glycerophosphotransferase family protein [Terrilactibacillus sp. S3-3]|nr:CDP-glycerol glycerophosphotransferase family protein [Terrilactibacillus sp. S3-3]